MLFSILMYLLSIVPSVLIFIWLRFRQKDNILYRKKCTYSFVSGLISMLPIILLSAILYVSSVVMKNTLLKDVNILVYKAIYNFIVLAFAEEIIKFFAFKIVLKRKPYAYSWADVVAFMVIIGAGFGLIENATYIVDANPILRLVRGLTMGHVGYGFIMGWFYGKKLQTGKKRYGVISILLPWLIHGLYDFSLTPELVELNDNFSFLGVSLALLFIVLIILTIRFFIRSKKQERYLQPVISLE